MAVCLDASVLALWLDEDAMPPVDPTTGEPVSSARQRIESYIAGFANKEERIVVPMPAFSEVLGRSAGDVQVLIDAISNVGSFALIPFGQREAIELAMMNRGALASGDKRRGVKGFYQKMKVDRQIIATAKVAGADVLLTDDAQMQRTARSEGLEVMSTADLPPPTGQPDMFGD